MGLLDSTGYSNFMGRVAKASTKYTLLNGVTGGRYSETAQKVAEKATRLTPVNMTFNATKGLFEESSYTKAAGKVGKGLVRYSGLNYLTGGRFENVAQNITEKVSRFSLGNVITNVLKK